MVVTAGYSPVFRSRQRVYRGGGGRWWGRHRRSGFSCLGFSHLQRSVTPPGVHTTNTLACVLIMPKTSLSPAGKVREDYSIALSEPIQKKTPRMVHSDPESLVLNEVSSSSTPRLALGPQKHLDGTFCGGAESAQMCICKRDAWDLRFRIGSSATVPEYNERKWKKGCGRVGSETLTW